MYKNCAKHRSVVFSGGKTKLQKGWVLDVYQCSLFKLLNRVFSGQTNAKEKENELSAMQQKIREIKDEVAGISAAGK